MAIPGLALGERLIVNRIKLFLTDSKTDPSIFTEMFAEDLTATELAEWNAFFAAVEDIPVVHAYPLRDTRMPMIHVIPSTERVSHPTVGDVVIDEFNDTSGNWEFTGGEYWNQNFGIGVWTKEPTTTLLLHHIVRVALVSSLDYFNTEGMLDVLLSGTPLQPHPELSPNLTYSRGLELSCKTLIPRTSLNSDVVTDTQATVTPIT